jgi:glycosyltransferase involved in cell wall biosynthesis
MVSEHASPLAAIGGADAGGQNVHVAALATELGRRGHLVTVYTRRDDPRAPRRVPLADGVVVEHVPFGPPGPCPKDELYPFVPELAVALARAWQRRPPAVVHAHFWMSGQAALLARALSRADVPILQTFHALGTVKRRHQGARDTSPPERLAVEQAVARGVDHLLATATDEVFELVRLGADPPRITVVPCGVDLSVFRVDGPVAPRGRSPRVVVVSRLVERKGIGNVVAALAHLPDVELVVAGGAAPVGGAPTADPELERLRGVAAEHGVADRVSFLGPVPRDDVPALLRSADVVCCTPWYEPFGIVALEAMACGVPVVATAVGGLVDTVVHGRTGLHVRPRDPRAVAGAIAELLADPPRRRTMAAAAAARAASYGWARVAEATAEAYATTAAARLAGPRRAGPSRLGDARSAGAEARPTHASGGPA